MKKLVLALFALVSLFAIPALADSSNYDFNNIYINGVGWQDGTIYVERGETIDIRSAIYGTGETTDVQVKAWLGGYEYDDVSATSEMFDVEDGVTYTKHVYLDLPNDLEAEKDYTLYVEIFDGTDSETETATLRVSKERHQVSLQDVIFENSVDAGSYSSVTVRLENTGDKKEEDIKVTVSVPELGIEESTYLDELTNDELDNEDEESSGDVSLTMYIPKDTETGDYTMNVDVTYDNGYETLESTESLHVEAPQTEETTTVADQGAVTVVVNTQPQEPAQTSEETKSTNFTTALRLGFGILAVLIVILALILIVRK